MIGVILRDYGFLGCLFCFFCKKGLEESGCFEFLIFCSIGYGSVILFRMCWEDCVFIFLLIRNFIVWIIRCLFGVWGRCIVVLRFWGWCFIVVLIIMRMLLDFMRWFCRGRLFCRRVIFVFLFFMLLRVLFCSFFWSSCFLEC